jgi:hypothetical protein
MESDSWQNTHAKIDEYTVGIHTRSITFPKIPPLYIAPVGSYIVVFSVSYLVNQSRLEDSRQRKENIFSKNVFSSNLLFATKGGDARFLSKSILTDLIDECDDSHSSDSVHMGQYLRNIIFVSG